VSQGIGYKAVQEVITCSIADAGVALQLELTFGVSLSHVCVLRVERSCNEYER
jgi:hypothetical protein